MMDKDVIQNSRAVGADEVRNTGCFTTLPVRISLRNELAEEGCLRAYRYWERDIGDGWEKKSHTWNPKGDFVALLVSSEPPRVSRKFESTD